MKTRGHGATARRRGSDEDAAGCGDENRKLHLDLGVGKIGQYLWCGGSGERLFLHKRSVHKALWVHSHEAKQGFTNQPKGSSSMLHAVPAHAVTSSGMHVLCCHSSKAEIEVLSSSKQSFGSRFAGVWTVQTSCTQFTPLFMSMLHYMHTVILLHS